MNEVRNFLRTFPEQLTQTFELADFEKIGNNFSHVIVCGMGGSGVVGNFLQALLPRTEVLVHKGYGFPSRELQNPLYCFISYSGQTEETLSAFHEVREAGKPLMVVSGGGTLITESEKDALARIVIPQSPNIPPRYALGHMLPAALHGLARAGVVEDATEMLQEARKELSAGNEARGQALAERLTGKKLFLYVPSRREAVGIYWKAVFNETAKLPVHLSIIPEAHHNEIEALPTEKNAAILLFEDPEMHPRLATQCAALVSVAEKRSWHVERIGAEGSHPLARMLNGALEGAFASITLAERAGITSTETPVINELKKYLRDH